MTFISKRMKKASEGLVAGKALPLTDAVKHVSQNAKAKFDETIELHVNLNIDTTQADQQLRIMIPLPHGTGKSVRVAVFAKGDKAEAAKKAGAEIVGAEDLVELINKGELNFDRCIATPDMMALVGRVGKVLGPRNLMPNPKLGTVTPNVAEAVKAAKSGAIECRAEKAGIVHVGVGKASFGEAKIAENVRAFVAAVSKAKPAGVKGTFIEKISICSTMGPGVKVDIPSVLNA